MTDLLVNVAPLEEALGVAFRDRRLLQQALVHKSYVNERPELGLESNERLEFLGDAVLGAVVADHLFRAYPTSPEGILTVLRASLVREATLADWARQVRLGEHLLLGRGEEQGGGRERDALLARAFEAVVGALYLDQGFEAARATLLQFVTPALERLAAPQAALDAKSRLQQVSQAAFEAVPTYRVVEVVGPQHSPTFTVEVQVGGIVARGTGKNKQAAEQQAAQAALERLEHTHPLRQP
ncbi:MAG TPA: ribonuclease III [Chloroflexota bacterium]